MISAAQCAAQEARVMFERYVDEVYRHMLGQTQQLEEPSLLRDALMNPEEPERSHVRARPDGPR